jgi:hypothetical protein
MGKLLSYLGIEEGVQTRDILDAERLLEGMQGLYANSPDGKKKDAFSVPLAEMTKTFIEQVKGIKAPEKPKEPQPQDEEVAEKLVNWFADYQQFFMKNEEVTPRIVYENEVFQKKYILWMQKAVLSLFNFNKEKIKILRDYLVTLNEDGENRKDFVKLLNKKEGELIEGSEFDSFLAYNFLGLYNILGTEAKENMIQAYKVIGNNYLNPALFENLMEINESSDNQGGTSTTLPSFIKPISEKEQKPSKPPKPSKPKPSKIKFEVEDMYSLLDSNGETTLTIMEVRPPNIKVKYADGSNGFFDLSTAESRVKNNVWKKIEQEQPEQEFKVGDVYYSELFKQRLTIDKVQSDTIFVNYEDNSSEQYTPLFCRIMVTAKDWVKVQDEKPQQDYKEGDSYLVLRDSGDTTLQILDVDIDNIEVKWADGNKGIFERNRFEARVNSGEFQKIEDEKPVEQQNGMYKLGDKFIASNNKDFIFTIDFIKYSNIGIIYEDGLTGNLERKDFEKGLKSGYYKPYNDSQQETELYLKVGDKFKEKSSNFVYLIKGINKDKDFFDYAILNKKNQESSNFKNAKLSNAQSNIKSGNWMLIDETKPTSKPRTPKTLTEKDKQIKHILDINIDDIDL